MEFYTNQNCVICKTQHHPRQVSNSSRHTKKVVKMFDLYSVYLKEGLNSKLFDWEHLSENEKKCPFCTDCYSSGEKLCSLDNQLKDIKKEINNLLENVTKMLKYETNGSANFSGESLHQPKVQETADSLDLNDFYSNMGFDGDCGEPQDQYSDDDVDIKNISATTAENNEFESTYVKTEIPELQTAYVLLERLQGNYEYDGKLGKRSGSRKRTVKCRPEVIISKRRKKRKQIFVTKVDVESKINEEDDEEAEESEKKETSRFRFECVPCESKFPSEAALKIHLNKHGNKVLKCNLCDKPFHTKWSRRSHKLKVHGIALGKRPAAKAVNFKKCEVCGEEKFSSKYDFEIHAMAHNNEIPYQCQFCTSKFSNIIAYENHQVNSNCPFAYRTECKFQFPCEFCEKTFKAKYILLVHMSIEHNPVEKGYDCTLCQQKYYKVRNLEAHAARHTSEFMYMCDICGMSLKGHVSLVEHRFTHKATVSFLCKYCNSGFKTRNCLMRHILIHDNSGITTNSCEHCGMELKNKTDLKRHVATHFKTIICDVCGKAFNRNVDLKTHYRIHTGELFDCPSCDRKFVSQYLLNQHIASFHFKIKSKADRVIKSRVKRAVGPDKSNTQLSFLQL